MFFLVGRDVFYLIVILKHHKGCRYGRFEELESQEPEDSTKIRIYNETRETIINLYRDLQKQLNTGDNGVAPEHKEDLDYDPDFFHIEDSEAMNEDFLYVVKKSMIIEQWKRRKTLKERKRRIMQHKAKAHSIKSAIA